MTRSSLSKEENLLISIIQDMQDTGCSLERMEGRVETVPLLVCKEIVTASSVACSQTSRVHNNLKLVGMFVGPSSCVNHAGPFHHKVDFRNCSARMPRVNKSAGLSFVGQY